jgi:hypothetical protein
MTQILNQLDLIKRTSLASPTLKSILKNHLQSLLLADKTSPYLDEFSAFLRKLRREMNASNTLMKCQIEEAAEIFRLIFSFVHCTVKDSYLKEQALATAGQGNLQSFL